ncbi:coiled-coil domain-containing protein 22 homolog isoform X1 [Durio zibethinus]|uniref:Coiled-coil domain-containing protein 22 homolog isoform X1 n=1 Tax=Durio zibethinus TaxID=66656 RepID=A0A6P5WL60_DURZI|nr:coiled-coil domain-containing protein 22 homolog isoform X1 [Durio zibethinus]
MEESQEILLNSLRSLGVSIPESVSSFNDLTPTTLISICSQSLNLLGNNKGGDDNDMSFPNSVEDSVSMADKFKICSIISLTFKNLGYVGDMNYYKFLHPSEEELYKLVRFLVERLSGSSEAVKFSGKKNVGLRQKIKEDNFKKVSKSFTQKPNNEEVDQNLQKVEAILKDLRVDELLESSNFKTDDAPISDPLRVNDIPQNELLNESTTEVVDSRSGASENEETADQKDDEPVSASPKEQYSEIQYEAENLLSQEKVLKEELGANTLQVQHLEEELGLWRAAADMAFDESHPMDFFLEQLNEQLDAKKHDIQELELQWEEEHLKLAADLKKRPKVASRRSYIERIKEITKNSGKLDTDIERILRETRELQLESNSIQESLHRTYAVVNETVLREAKKDTVGRQAYRLLTSIHERFEQISEKILATDRIRREMADREKKLATMASRSLNVDKQQADLDAILKENEYLEQQLQDN